jgi:uncharacterized protein YjbJ (UPF0337 family)
MVNQQTVQGNWNEIKGKLRQRWGQLTEDDLPETQGEVEQLVGTIQRKTGEGREAIESYLRQLSSNVSESAGAAAQTMRRFTDQAADRFGQMSQQAADQLRAGYEGAQRVVRDQPGMSLGICFGLGALTGLLLGLSLRTRD